MHVNPVSSPFCVTIVDSFTVRPFRHTEHSVVESCGNGILSTATGTGVIDSSSATASGDDVG